MIQDRLENETEIRRFLLGEMPDGERNSFEAKFFADEDLFEQIRVGEDDLIEKYVRGTLRSAGKTKFESAFLTTKKSRERVAFTSAMLGNLEKFKQTAAVKKIETVAENTSVFDSIINFFKTPKFAFSAAFALLLLVFAGWFLLKTPNETEIVKQTAPTPTSAETPISQNTANNQIAANNSNVTPTNKPDANKNVNTNAENKNTNKPVEPPKPSIVTLALFAGTVRSEGKTGELNLPRNAGSAHLQLKLESQDYQTYRAEIADADGKTVYRSGNLSGRNSKINIFVPAKNLKNGDYMIKLYGFNSSGEEESAADFQFRVNRK